MRKSRQAGMVGSHELPQKRREQRRPPAGWSTTRPPKLGSVCDHWETLPLGIQLTRRYRTPQVVF
eukprot:1302651-Pyramimonas_sp.AAC.1